MGIKDKRKGPEPIPQLQRWQEVALDYRCNDEEMIAAYIEAYPGTRATRAKLKIGQYLRQWAGRR